MHRRHPFPSSLSNRPSNCPGRFIGKLASKLLTDGTMHRHMLSPLRDPSVCLSVLWVRWLAGWLAGSLQQSFSSFPSQLIDLSILSLRFLLPSSVPPSPLFQSPSCPPPSDPNTPIAGVPSGKTVETWLGDDVNLSSDSPMMRAACPPPHPPHRATLRIPATRLTFSFYALWGESRKSILFSFFSSKSQKDLLPFSCTFVHLTSISEEIELEKRFNSARSLSVG